jgi:hypothetical protein
MSIVPSAPAVSSTIQQATVTASPTSTNSTPIPSSSQSNSSNGIQDDKQSSQKPQQFSNLSVNDLILNTSFNSGNSSTVTNSNSLSLPSSVMKSASTESLVKANEQPQIQPTQQQTVNYDEFNIYMWSVCKICNKVFISLLFIQLANTLFYY